ncbi:hypothetical protein ACVWWN_000810 [Mycobacterium sp. URHB0021]
MSGYGVRWSRRGLNEPGAGLVRDTTAALRIHAQVIRGFPTRSNLLNGIYYHQ